LEFHVKLGHLSGAPSSDLKITDAMIWQRFFPPLSWKHNNHSCNGCLSFPLHAQTEGVTRHITGELSWVSYNYLRYIWRQLHKQHFPWYWKWEEILTSNDTETMKALIKCSACQRLPRFGPLSRDPPAWETGREWLTKKRWCEYNKRDDIETSGVPNHIL
jgi:hypothetical protein